MSRLTANGATTITGADSKAAPVTGWTMHSPLASALSASIMVIFGLVGPRLTEAVNENGLTANAVQGWPVP